MTRRYYNKCEELMEEFQCTASVQKDGTGPYILVEVTRTHRRLGGRPDGTGPHILVEVSGEDQATAQERLFAVSNHLKAYRTHERGVEPFEDRYVARLTARLRSDGSPPTG
jgi:hypothetical protein